MVDGEASIRGLPRSSAADTRRRSASIRGRGSRPLYPGGTRALEASTLRIAGWRAGRDHRPERQRQIDARRHLDGLLRPTEGRVLLGGADAAHATGRRLAAVVGLAFQDPGRQIFSGEVR